MPSGGELREARIASVGDHRRHTWDVAEARVEQSPPGPRVMRLCGTHTRRDGQSQCCLLGRL